MHDTVPQQSMWVFPRTYSILTVISNLMGIYPALREPLIELVKQTDGGDTVFSDAVTTLVQKTPSSLDEVDEEMLEVAQNRIVSLSSTLVNAVPDMSQFNAVCEFLTAIHDLLCEAEEHECEKGDVETTKKEVAKSLANTWTVSLNEFWFEVIPERAHELQKTPQFIQALVEHNAWNTSISEDSVTELIEEVASSILSGSFFTEGASVYNPHGIWNTPLSIWNSVTSEDTETLERAFCKHRLKRFGHYYLLKDTPSFDELQNEEFVDTWADVIDVSESETLS